VAIKLKKIIGILFLLSVSAVVMISSFSVMWSYGEYTNVRAILFTAVLAIVAPYLAVRFLHVRWWLPSLLLVLPMVAMVIEGFISPISHPYFFIPPIILVSLAALLAGKVGDHSASSGHA